MLVFQPWRRGNRNHFWNRNLACRHHSWLGQTRRLTWKIPFYRALCVVRTHQSLVYFCISTEKASSSQRPSQSGFSRTGSAPSPAPISRLYSKSWTRLAVAAVSTHDDHSPPPAPPKGRQGVLRPATVTFPPVLLPSESLLPQRRSHALPARPSPAHTNLQMRNSTPARTQTPFRLNHLRPWHWHTFPSLS